MSATIALLLADGRFPSGGHAHSGGVEAAVDDGRIADLPDLAAFLAGRLTTAGRVAAGLAAAACAGTWDLDRLDAEAGARIASPALRRASRQQGGQLLRAYLRTCNAQPPNRWLSVTSSDGSGREGPYHPVAIGVVARAAGLAPVDAARWAAYDAVAGPAGAAVRLLGLDPFATWAAVAALAPQVDEIANEAYEQTGLPACSAPLLDMGAERHAVAGTRLFAS